MSNPDLHNKNPSTIVVYSTVWCPDCKRAKKFFGEQRVKYTNVDIEKDPKGMEFVEEANDGKHIIPTIVFPDGEILVVPSNAQLANKLDLKTEAERTYYDTIIIGGGPAGLTAALYLAREGVETLLIEKSGMGGQAGITQVIDNFPGFDEGISGAEFAERLTRQARRFDVEILQAQEVSEFSRDEQNYLEVWTADGSCYCTRALLIATGAGYRRLDIPGEDELIGTNVHYCATCDGAFYKGKKVLVVGGGNSGFEEGIFLTKFARQVDIVEYQPEVKARQILQEKVADMSDMKVITNHAVKELTIKDDRLDKVIVENRATGESGEWDYDGVFVFIGLTPNSDLLKGKAELDQWGFAKANDLMTSMEGVFVAGDVRAGSTKQAASAAGEGATAALKIREYLQRLGG
jgi:thioredoxin reductase (NADPH)